jgi:hypothetical protein
MKLINQLLLFVVCVVLGEDSYWGNSLCGACKDDVQCDAKTGKCPNGCKIGWKGEGCNEPLCEDVPCGPEGKCIRPNECVCDGLYYFDPESKGCYSLRTSGLKGAAISVVVIVTAISLCGGIQHKLAKSS